jgi:hypothetical protein
LGYDVLNGLKFMIGPRPAFTAHHLSPYRSSTPSEGNP